MWCKNTYSYFGVVHVVVSPGVFQPLVGTCVYFLRLGDKAITTSAIAEQVFCGYIDSAPVMSEMLHSFEETIGKVLVPLLREQEVCNRGHDTYECLC